MSRKSFSTNLKNFFINKTFILRSNLTRSESMIDGLNIRSKNDALREQERLGKMVDTITPSNATGVQWGDDIVTARREEWESVSPQSIQDFMNDDYVNKNHSPVSILKQKRAVSLNTKHARAPELYRRASISFPIHRTLYDDGPIS